MSSLLINLTLLSLTALSAGGCVTVPLDVEVSDDFIVGKGRTDRARSCAFYLFGVIPLAGDSAGATAIAKLTEGHAGQRLTRLNVDVEHAYYIFVTRQCTIATGTFVSTDSHGDPIESPNTPEAPNILDVLEERSSPETIELQLKCDGGSFDACTRLGEMLREGTSVPKDSARAARLLLRACEGGGAAACASLGYLFTVGEGVQMDNGRAVDLFKRACARDDARGCSFLGAMLETGRGIATNATAAIEAYRRACDGGYAQACDRLKVLGK